MLRGFHACPVKWVSRKIYCFLNTTGSKLSLGEQIYFLEPASNIWKDRRKVIHCKAWFSQLTGNTQSDEEWKGTCLEIIPALVTRGIRRGQEPWVLWGNWADSSLLKATSLLSLCATKGCNIPLYPRYCLLLAMDTAVQELLLQTQHEAQSSTQHFWGEKLDCSKCYYV